MRDAGTDVDVDQLESYLSDHLDERIVGTTVLEEGLNQIIRVATATDPGAYVVRLPNKGRADEGFIDIATEHKVLLRLGPTDVPDPGAVHL